MLQQFIDLFVVLNIYHVAAILDDDKLSSGNTTDYLFAMGFRSQSVRIADYYEDFCMLKDRQSGTLVMILERG